MNQGTPKTQLILALFRFATWVDGGPARPWRRPVVALYTLIVNWILGVELPAGTQVGTRLRIFHPQTIIINVGTRIGNDCTIRGATILGNIVHRDGTISGCPVLGDGAELGAGVIIIGPVDIGEGARIGAGAVVTKSVPPHGVAVGNPAHLLNAMPHTATA